MTEIPGQSADTSSRAGINQHLATAQAYVLDAWLPLEPKLLQSIKQRLRDGAYDNNCKLLVQELKSDFSLFIFCVRRLSEMLRAKTDPLVEWVDPLEALEQSSLEDFKKIFECPASFISPHRLDTASPLQSERLSHSLLSASVASVLSEKHGINPDLAYSAALFRELGLTLIAFNYPHVYQRVMTNLTPQETIDEFLSKLLGFSPSLLGITIAQSWSICPKVRLAMGDASAESQMDSQTAAIGKKLEKFCQVGEALARASNPLRYPSAASDWVMARREIERCLGAEQFEALQTVIEQSLSNYLKAAPELFKLPELTFQEAQPVKQQAAGRIFNNKYIRYCPLNMQQDFEILYSTLERGTIQKESISFLINQIIVPSGFPSGCVYLVEPDSLTLVPRLAIGSAALNSFQTLNYNVLTKHNHPVLAAFRSPLPITEDSGEGLDKQASFIAGCLGNMQRAGVLYLEISQSLLDDARANPQVYFKAIRQALNDCLHLD